MAFWSNTHWYPKGSNLFARGYRRHLKKKLANLHKKAIKISLACKESK